MWYIKLSSLELLAFEMPWESCNIPSLAWSDFKLNV